MFVKCKNQSETSNKMGNWNHCKIVQKIHEQCLKNPTPRNYRKENWYKNYAGTMYSTSENPNVKVQNVYHWE